MKLAFSFLKKFNCFIIKDIVYKHLKLSICMFVLSTYEKALFHLQLW